MRNKTVATLMLLMLAASILPIFHAAAVDVTLTLSDAELFTQFTLRSWSSGTLAAVADIPGPGVRFDFNGGIAMSDDYPVSQLAGGDPDSIGGWADFRKYTQYRLVFTNVGPVGVSLNLWINTGFLPPNQKDTFWEIPTWGYVNPGESRVVTLDFSNARGYKWATPDPVPEWVYPTGTAGLIIRRLSEVTNIGFQAIASGPAAIIVSATTPSDVVLSLPDDELSTFAKETGPATVSVVDLPGPGVRFDFTGLSSSVGTVVGDNFPVSGLAGGAYKDYGSGFSGPYDFSGYSKYSLVFKNVGTTTVQVNLKMNTGWTAAPWGRPENDTFWQNSWTTVAPGESRIVILDFWSAEVYNALNDPVSAWQYADGTSGVIVRRLDEVSNIGFQVLGGSDASIIVIGETILTLSDVEMGTQFAYETGPGTVTSIVDISGPGVKFDFTGLRTDVGTIVGDNFPVSALAGGAYKTYGVTNPFSTWGDFFEYTKYKMIFTNIGPNPVTVNLKINTGWTNPPPEYAVGWRDTFWQGTWTTINPGESKVITIDFNSAEVWNAGDEQEYRQYPGGTAGVPVWRLDEVSDIGFQILGDGAASIIVSAYPAISEAFVDDNYNSSTPGWGYDHFAKIQDGVDAVIPGGIVHVYDGTYNERVVITKSGLRILAGSSPILDGTGLLSSGFLLMADNVEIGGFIIQNFQHPVFDVAGIEFRGANHCWIHDNEIRYNNHGIVFGDSTFMSLPSNNYNLIEHNTIHDNLNSANPLSGNGIKYWYGVSSHNTLYENSVYNHRYNGILVGQHEIGYYVGFGGHTDWHILDNTLNNNAWFGIAITNGLNSEIEGNTVNNTGRSGILVQAWDFAAVYNINVTNNIVENSGYFGIQMYATNSSSPYINVISSTIHDVRIASNEVYKSLLQGIYTSSDPVLTPSGIHHLTIESNTVHGTTLYNGMLFSDLINSKVSQNEVYFNGIYSSGSGIVMYLNSGSDEVSYNKIHDNFGSGIKVYTNGHVIKYNEIENNVQDGIWVDGDNNVIERNKITGNIGPFSGIHLTTGADGDQVHYNCIVGNVGTNVYGVYKEGGSTVNATYNWWGDSTGPYHPTKNPAGLGNQVSDYVLFDPWLKAYFDYSPKNPTIDEDVTFDATLSTKPCNLRTIVSFTWNFDDGTGNFVETDPIIVHSFSASGDYNVTLTLTFDDATTATEWAMLYVSEKPVMKVEPAAINLGLLYKTFQINVTINDLDVNLKAVGVQFRLLYNATLLDVINVAEGPFMKDPRWNLNGELFVSFVGDSPTYGSNVLVGIMLYPNASGYWEAFPYGSGVIATITFNATYQERGLEKPPLTCGLTLNDTIIMDENVMGIPHLLQHSVYNIYPTHIGDFNYDGKVNMEDLGRVAYAFGSYPGHPRWDPICDIDENGKIDMVDVGVTARGFGWTPTYDP